MATSRGRPRVHDKSITPSDRARKARQTVIAAGGAYKTFLIGKEANDALKTLMAQPDAPSTEVALIEALLLDALQKNKRVK